MPEDRNAIVRRLVGNAAEIITEEEFRERLGSARRLTHYIGFEISGYVHLGTGIMSARVMKDLTDLGVRCTVWLADWHTWINDKLGGDKETAARVGRGYFTEALKASFIAVGGDPENLEFRLASEWYERDPMAYWETVVTISKHTTLSRMQRSIDIMGRREGERADFATFLYPPMQVADIFYQGIDIAHAGMDQRKAHVVMRDVADHVSPGNAKPIALHHPLLLGLQKPPTWPLPDGADRRDVILEMKMSKSRRGSAIWIHDAPAVIEAKVAKAFCPEKEVAYNPILNWVGRVLFWNRAEPFVVTRAAEHGGSVSFASYEALERAYASGGVHPADLKAAVAQELIELLAPVRAHFQKRGPAKNKAELDALLSRERSGHP